MVLESVMASSIYKSDTYSLTAHIRSRCQQREIKERDLDIVATFGTESPKGVILTRKDCTNVE